MMKTKQELTPKQQKGIAIASIIIFVAILTALVIVIGIPLIKFVSEPEKFRQWVDTHGIWGQLLYMFCVILQILVAFIPGEPLELVAGYAFGAIHGTVLCLLASTIGSVLVFGLVRRFGTHLVEVFYPVEKLRELRFLKKSKKRDILYAIIFFIPGTPKDLLCYFGGLTDMKFTTYFLITSLGRLPAMITSTLSGNSLGTASYKTAVIIIAVTLIISGLGLLIYRHICKKNNRDSSHS